MRNKVSLICQKNNLAALYMRISKEDEKLNESASIETQRKLLSKFAIENGFTIYKEYVDDGFSGTNMNRPALKQMKYDIKMGKIGIVLTKDLSRLGRNSGQVNLMLDEYFFVNKVRYISISEGIDTMYTASVNNFIAPVINFTNEMYAGDISRKIRSSLAAKIEAGEYIGSFAPYGYKKDPLNKNHLLPDCESAEIVKKIFNCAKAGYSPKQISQILNSDNILTPLQYRYKVNPHLNENTFKKNTSWSASSVGKILRNEVYLGHTLQGKTIKPNFKSKYTYAKPRDQWVKITNTHQALVSNEVWQIVRKRMKSRAQKREKGFVNIFSGIAKCADCGKNMSTVNTRKKRAKANLNCGAYKFAGLKKCTSHSIDYNLLYDAVLNVIREQISLTAEQKEEIVNYTINKLKVHNKSKSAEIQKKLENINKKLTQLYDDKYSGIICKEQFDTLLLKFKTEKYEIQNKIKSPDNTEKHKNQYCEIKSKRSKIRNIISEYENLPQLTQEILFKFIDRIDVYQGEYINGVKHQKIKIYLKLKKRQQ